MMYLLFQSILLLIFLAYGIATVLPGLAITVRRLRDAGYN